VELGHSDPIETVTFKHEEGNEGEKIGVKRGIVAFYGGKLLKRQGRDDQKLPSAPEHSTLLHRSLSENLFCWRDVAKLEIAGLRLIIVVKF
jgi:hypothetical protein